MARPGWWNLNMAGILAHDSQLVTAIHRSDSHRFNLGRDRPGRLLSRMIGKTQEATPPWTGPRTQAATRGEKIEHLGKPPTIFGALAPQSTLYHVKASPALPPFRLCPKIESPITCRPERKVPDTDFSGELRLSLSEGLDTWKAALGAVEAERSRIAQIGADVGFHSTNRPS